MNSYVFNWGYYSKKVYSQLYKLETRLSVLKGETKPSNESLELIGLDKEKIKKFKSLKKADKDAILNAMNASKQKLVSVINEAEKGKFIGRVGIVTRVNGQTYNALMRISAGMELK